MHLNYFLHYPVVSLVPFITHLTPRLLKKLSVSQHSGYELHESMYMGPVCQLAHNE